MEKEFKKISNQLPSKSWCPQVLTGLSIQADGMAPCCEWDGEKIKANTIKEYKKDPIFKQLLQDIENGRWNKGCIKCMLREKNGQSSQRLREVKNQLGSYGATDRTSSSIFYELFEKDQYLWVNLQPTNKCNQACVMCWAGSSSKLEEEVKNNPDTHWLGTVHKFHRYNNISELASHRHPKGRLYLSGGEPSVMKDVINYLDSIPNPEEIQVDMNTNFNSFNNKFWEILGRFKKLHIMASIDAIGNRSEYIRYLSKWQTVEDNLLKTKDKLPNASIKINPTWTMFNIWYADELANWCREYEFEVYLNNVAYNAPFALMYLHDDYKLDVNKTFLNTHWIKTNKEEVHEIVEAVNSAKFDINRFNQFRDYISRIDKIRNTSTFEIFPKIKEYINGVMSKEY